MEARENKIKDKYIIVERDNKVDLIKDVNILVLENYIPIGGVQVDYIDGIGICYLQSMILQDPVTIKVGY